MKMDSDLIDWVHALIMATTYVSVGYLKADRLATLAKYASERDKSYRPLTEYEIFLIMALWPIFTVYGFYITVTNFFSGGKDGKD